MTIATSTARADYAGDNVSTVFAVPFYFLDATHLEVVKRDAAGAEVPQTKDVHYTVSGAAVPAGGAITMLTAPAGGEQLTIRRKVPITQTLDYVANDPFPAESHERGLDKLTMIVQQQTEEISRSLRARLSDGPLATLPRLSDRAGRVLAFDPTTGDPVAGALIANLDAAIAAVLSGVSIGEISSVPTIAAMTALLKSTLTDGDAITVLGYHSAGDGGGGVFRWTAGSSATTDGGMTIAAGEGGTGRWRRVRVGGDINVLWFGARGDNATLGTTAFQAAIDYAASLYVGGSQIGGGATIFMPGGRYRLGALIMKNGVSLRGEGRMVTQLRVSGNNVTLLAASANTATQTSASNLFYGSYSDFAILSYEGATGGTASGQVGWDAIGFSRWTCWNMYFGWGAGFTGVRANGSIPAGDDGPSHWYNSFYGCIAEKHFVSTGGVGLDLGDTSSDKEQITTWVWIGGAIRGSGDGTGTGLALRSSTGSIFLGVCFESVGTAVALGSSAGTRQANYNGIVDCYFEGNTTNWIEYAGCVGNRIRPVFVTGGTSSSAGTATDFDAPGAFRRCITGSDVTDFGELYAVNPATRHWKFTSGSAFGAVGIENDAGTELIIANGAASSTASTYGEFLEDDLSTNLLSFGRSQARFQAKEIIAGNTNASAFAMMGGSGAPSGAPTAARAIYIRTDGGVGTTLYVWSGAAWTAVAGV